MNTRWSCLLVCLVALLVRLPALDSRPFHPDEAVNAHLLDGLLAGDGFTYRAHDHHGPSLFYTTAAVLSLTGPVRMAKWEAWHLRLFPALVGTVLAGGACLALGMLAGPVAGLATGLLLALAAPFVYVSGTFIHETFLLVCLLAWMVCAWRCATTGSLLAALLGGLAGGLALWTKETAAPILGLLALALVVATRPPLARLLRVLGLGAVAALVVVWLGYGGPALLQAIGAQVARGTGSEHAYPFFTYAVWFLAPTSVGWPWSGWIVLALAVTAVALRHREPVVHALALGGSLLLLFFALLPYKTPWLILAPALPLVALAGLGFASLAERLPGHVYTLPSLLLGIGLLGLLGVETEQRCRRYDVAAGNPLAYSPGSRDLARLEATLDRVPGTPVQVVAADYWPVPWTARRHPTGFWATAPAVLRPGWLLVSPEQLGAVAGRAADFAPFEIRPGLTLFLGRVP